MKCLMILASLLLLVSCGERKLSVEEQGECIEAIEAESIKPSVQNFYVDEYGYLCCVISPTDLNESPDGTAESTYTLCCKPPLRGVKILNPDGTVIGKYTK